MGRIVFIGGGIVGTCAAMMLAQDGHDVTVLERDPAPPPPPAVAWDDWDRRGVNQFRMVHMFLSRFRQVVDAELPGLTDGLVAAGALRMNPIASIPEQITGGWREGDERFELVTARRPVAESVVAAIASGVEGLTVRRGVAVTALVGSAGPGGIVHVSGVRTDDGDALAADLVVDSSGRRSAVPGLLQQLGAAGPHEQVEDVGFVYYARHFRSADGSTPPMFGPGLQHYGSVSTITLPADNGTWGVGIVASAKDASMRAVTDADRWTAVVRAFPLVAHWTDAEPITEVKVMAKLEDRVRQYVHDGAPVATGILPLADAWACTNPSLGRGISIGITHAATLRRLLAGESFTDQKALALRWHELTATDVQPLLDDTLAFDRHRLAEIEATIDGQAYETDDPGWRLGQALGSAATKDPDLLRASMDIGLVLSHDAEVFARPGLAERALRLADPAPLPGPDRAGLLALLGS